MDLSRFGGLQGNFEIRFNKTLNALNCVIIFCLNYIINVNKCFVKLYINTLFKCFDKLK